MFREELNNQIWGAEVLQSFQYISEILNTTKRKYSDLECEPINKNYLTNVHW